MRFEQTNLERLTPVKRRIALICVLLIAVMIGAQALHAHPNEFSSAAKHCTVCQIAHTSLQVATLAHVDFGLKTTAYLPVSEDPDAPRALDSLPLFCRPPPAA